MKADRVTQPSECGPCDALWAFGHIPMVEWYCGKCRVIFLAHPDWDPTDCPVCHSENVRPFEEEAR